jgi:hypothetical protein
MRDMIMEKILQTYLEDNTFIINKDVLVKEYSNNELSFLKWENQSKPEPTKAQLDAISEQLFPSYKANREAEYPSIQEQLDMQYWDKVNGTTNWEDLITKIKTDNPKN